MTLNSVSSEFAWVMSKMCSTARGITPRRSSPPPSSSTLSEAASAGSRGATPSMVNVFPLPVCPYANTVA